MCDHSERRGGGGETVRWPILVAITLPFLGVVYLFCPEAMPYGFFDLWTPKGTVAEWWWAVLPLFAWAITLSCFTIGVLRWKLVRIAAFEERVGVGEAFAAGFLRSMVTGFLEEVSFRWLLFLGEIAVVQFVNWLVFGWAGFGVVEWLQIWIFGPVADFFTGGYLRDIFRHDELWMVGSAVLATNALFRNEHANRGIIGFLNSWCIGMYCFWLTFRFGLPAAIVAHFAYNLLVAAIAACAIGVARAFSRPESAYGRVRESDFYDAADTFRPYSRWS